MVEVVKMEYVLEAEYISLPLLQKYIVCLILQYIISSVKYWQDFKIVLPCLRQI